MRLFKFGLRVWIMLTSVMSFLMGWIMIAHAPKPTQGQTGTTSSANLSAYPTLAPLPDMNTGNAQTNGNIFQGSPFSVQPSIQTFTQTFNSAPAPVFRTGGS